MRSIVKHSLTWMTLTVLMAVFLAAAGAEQTVDLDLSACSRGVIYAQMTQVCRAPAGYDGMLFRVKGKFNYSEKNELARIIFSDSTGCCEIALVFEPARELRFPDDYPPLWADILITARLTADQTDPDMPCYFSEAVIEWEK